MADSSTYSSTMVPMAIQSTANHSPWADLYERVRKTAAYARLREAASGFCKTVTEELCNEGALTYADEETDGPRGQLYFAFSEETTTGLAFRAKIKFEREPPNDPVRARKVAEYLESTELKAQFEESEDEVTDPESFSDSLPPGSRSSTPSFFTPPCTSDEAMKEE